MLGIIARNGVARLSEALRQQLSILNGKKKRPKWTPMDRRFWIGLSRAGSHWRRALIVVHPDTVVRWQRERFRRAGRPSIRNGLR